MKSEHHENNRVLIVDDQPEIHDDFKEMLSPRLAQAVEDNLAAAFMREEEEAWLPEFELLHASNGEQAYEIIQTGKKSNRPIA
ncbi:MAG: hypothetical protein F4105_01580, partial [Gemmatimonadetes bacterium]|nr:hypothetical protein [Gemmatimonadota bacterium]